jgi:hypothetical protein
MAVVAPFLHPASSFVNLRGQHSLPPDSPRLARLLARHEGRVRALGREALEKHDATFLRIGYRVDTADCFVIDWRPDGGDWLSRAANRLAGRAPSGEPLSVTSCALRPATRDPLQAQREQRVSLLFDRIEKACPRLFRGQTAVTDPLANDGWSRNYTGLDAQLQAFGDHVVLSLYRAGRQVDLGRLSAWEQAEAPVPPPCR